MSGARDVLLLGGGRDAAGQAAHAPLRSLAPGRVAVVCEDDLDRWIAAVDGDAEAHLLADGPPTIGRGCTAVYVAGGHTPTYAQLLRGWCPPPGLPYAGFSAGAVDAGLVERGVAIDEGTCVHLRGDDVAVLGTGAAWFVTPGRVHRVRAT